MGIKISYTCIHTLVFEGAQFSSVSFARNVKDNFFLKDHKSRVGLVSAIDKLHSTKGSATGIGRGLQVTIYNSKPDTNKLGDSVLKWV